MKEMLELAERAVEAAKFWDVELDYSAESLEPLEKMMQTIYRSHGKMPLPEEILLSVANLYGAYLGEGEFGIGREDMHMWPLTKVYKRITLGPEHDLMNFFECMFGLAIGAVDLDDPRMHVLSQEAV